MSTTVIGPYEDDDPTEACSTIHHEVIGTTTCLSGGEDVPLAPDDLEGGWPGASPCHRDDPRRTLGNCS